MKFCEHCSNMLFPKDGQLYCKLCDKYYEMTGEEARSTKKIINKEEDYEKIEVVTVSVGEKNDNSRYLRDEDNKIKMYDLK